MGAATGAAKPSARRRAAALEARIGDDPGDMASFRQANPGSAGPDHRARIFLPDRGGEGPHPGIRRFLPRDARHAMDAGSVQPFTAPDCSGEAQMREIEFQLHRQGAVSALRLVVDQLVIAGWTGRDPAKLQHHIDELAALGVAPPATIPCFYRAGVETLTQAARPQVLGGDSSGEAEWILLVTEEGILVGAGSDHTDRRVEAYSIPVSKQMCPKPIARDLWPIEEVEPHWDELIVASEIEERGGFVSYQRGTAEAMRHPRDILAHAARQGVPHGPGTLIFGGTLPVIGGIRPARRFRYRLEDPRLGRRIEGVYETQEL
jgi:hypothetical protein